MFIYSDTYKIIEFEVEGFLSSEKLKIFQEQDIVFWSKKY